MNAVERYHQRRLRRMDSKLPDDIQAFYKRRDMRLDSKGLPPAHRLDILYLDADEEQWITMNGTPVLVKEGQTAEEAGKAFAEKKESERGSNEVTMETSSQGIGESIANAQGGESYSSVEKKESSVDLLPDPSDSKAMVSQAVNDKLGELRQLSAQNGIEYLSLIDAEGKQVDIADGTDEFVNPSEKMLDAMRNYPQNSLSIVHSHPDGSPHSGTDMRTMAYESVGSVSIPGNGDMQFTVSAPIGSRPPKQLVAAAFNNAMADAAICAAKDPALRALPFDELKDIVHQNTVRLAADALGWTYGVSGG